MKHRIIYTDSTGVLNVISPTAAHRTKPGNAELSDADYHAAFAAKHIPAGLPWRVVLETDLPPDDEFRSAWRDDKKAIGHDMDKCRGIHMERIRAARDKKLAALDVETMKGRDVQPEKQKLRDLPKTLDLSKAKTPAQLRALWPNEIKD